MGSRNINQEIFVSAGQFSKEKAYWTDILSKEQDVTHFPYDYYKTGSDENKKSRDNDEPGIAKFRLEGELFSRLMTVANYSDPRLFILLVAGLMLLLHKYTGNDDIIIGAPIDRQETQGELVNTVLAFRNQLADDMTFKELLYRVRQTVVEASQNLNYPIETLANELYPDINRNESFPLFETAIIFHNIHDKNYLRHIKLNIIFSFSRTGESIEGEVEYNLSMYKQETIQRIIAHFTHLLVEAFNDANSRLADIALMTDAERNHLLVDMNNTKAEYPENKTVYQLFAEQVERTPDHQAVIDAGSGNSLTYGELNEKSNRFAALLQKKGVEPGVIVGIMGERTLEIIIGILAILEAGGTFLPLDAQNPDERLKFILADSGTRLFFTQKHILEQRREVFQDFDRGNLLALDDETIYLENTKLTIPSLTAFPTTNIAYIIYTSGTTGKPKGVMISHKSLVNYIHWAIKNYVHGEMLNFPLYTSIGFDLTVTSLFAPLITGSAVVVYSGWAKGNLIEQIVDDNKVGVVKLTPSHLQLIRDKKILVEQCKLKRFIVGGEALEYQLARDISDNFNGCIEIYNEYGPTEATVGCMLYKFDPQKSVGGSGSVSIGAPAANTQIYLFDKNLAPVPVGAAGELYISGVCLAAGYLNRPELTAERFQRNVISHLSLVISSNSNFPNDQCPVTTDNPLNHLNDQCPMANDRFYKTGDLARRKSDGNIEFIGRLDSQVKIRGFRIELEEIERHLLAYQGIKNAVVTTREKSTGETSGDEKQDRYLCAYFVSDKPLVAADLREYLTGRLPDYMVPLFFINLDQIPLTSNGKVDLKALPSPEIKTGTEYVSPSNKKEEQLAGIWAKVLGIDQAIIGIDDSFFELGGHSLSATILLTHLHKEANIKIPLIDIFKYPTIRALAEHIEGVAEERFESIPPTEEKEYYALSSAQQRLYFLQQLEPANQSYNISFVLELEGVLDKEKLEQVFTLLIKRHESFRTSFELVEERPYQRIHRDVNFKLEYSCCSEEQKEELLGKKIKAFIRPFKLDEPPLLRVALVKVTEQNHVLMIDMHHGIADGISIMTFINESLSLYAGEELPILQIQYKDYSEWYNSEKKQEHIKQQTLYWQKEYEGDIPVLDLPLDYPRPPLQSFEGRSIGFIIDEQTFLPLKDIAVKEESTIFILVLAAFNIMLAKLSGQEQIIVGTPTSGRRHADLEPVIGMFLNTLAIRNDLHSQKTTAEFLNDVKKKTLDAFDNQDYQFEDLVEQIIVSRDVSRNPLFDVMFNLDNINVKPGETPEMKIPQLKLKPYYREKIEANFDLTLKGSEGPKELILSFQYCTKLFKKETIERFVNYFNRVLASISENRQRKISEISIITAEEKKQLLFDFNNTKKNTAWDKPYSQLFEEQAAKTPGKIAAMYTGEHLTYRKLNEEANSLAHFLLEKGVTANTIVSLYLSRSTAMLVSIIGTFKAGGAYVPIEVEYPRERIEYILENSETGIVITETSYLEIIDNIKASSARLKKNLCLAHRQGLKNVINGYPVENPGQDSDPNDLAYMIYTSGTTGKPKGVMIHQQGMINHLFAKINDLAITADDIIAQTASACFDISVWQFLAGFLTGGATFIIPKETVMEPQLFLKVLQQGQISILESVPSLMTAFLEVAADGRDKTLDSLRWMVPTGEPLTPSLVRQWYTHFPHIKLLNAYGPTEASDDVTHYLVNELPSASQTTIPIGKPLQNLHIYILDRYLKLCPVGVRGEICVAGVGVGKGYWKDAGKTQSAFIPNPYLAEIGDSDYASMYKTGDIGYFRADGNIECLGRLDFQVKIRGNRIELEEIERQLLAHEQIKEAVVAAKDDDRGGKYLCAYYISSLPLEPLGLREYLSGKLPGYMVPAHFMRLDNMPLTHAGKINRKALPNPDEITPDQERKYLAPRNELEKNIAEIWQDVIGVDSVGINDNYFNLGGDSIKAIRITARLRKANLKLELADLFRYPTIAELSLRVKPMTGENETISNDSSGALVEAQEAETVFDMLNEIALDD
ncbi:MAG: amino acid adenylation domain-containing protein [Acidobacteria bacterium]|jgi:tyrocidine synthetase-3|nr:amino acid adenylation domain-containing protein [Acidobacteriota bacterium]